MSAAGFSRSSCQVHLAHHASVVLEVRSAPALPADSSMVASLRGGLCYPLAAAVIEPVLRITARGDRLILDCSAVTFFDAAGVAALLQIRRRMGERAGSLALWDPSPCVALVLDALALDRRTLRPVKSLQTPHPPEDSTAERHRSASVNRSSLRTPALLTASDA